MVYFAGYLLYLLRHQESELLHWVTLVLVPTLLLAVCGRYRRLSPLLASMGLAPQRASRGLGLALLLGVGFLVLQLLNTRQRLELLAGARHPGGLLAPLLALILLFGTAATTEEVFFRGILQTRLATILRSEAAALGLSTLAFVAYHAPYASLNPAWPSAGDLPAALYLAAANGAIAGLALGGVFWRGRRNLFASICLHALIDLVPATRLVLGWIGGSG